MTSQRTSLVANSGSGLVRGLCFIVGSSQRAGVCHSLGCTVIPSLVRDYVSDK
jgi:hypothetical protein